MPHEPNEVGIDMSDIVKRFVDYSVYGRAITGMAITERCQWILDNQERIKTDPQWNNGMFIGEMWIQSAQDWFDMNPQYKRK